MGNITPLLWCDGRAEEVAGFYVSIFANSKIDKISRFGEGGSAVMVEFELDGENFMALNGGDVAKEAAPGVLPRGGVALFVNCETQAEVDRLWERLSDGGEIIRCGWLKDKYGFAWNIVPAGVRELLGDPDPKRAKRAMEAMLAMKKLDVAEMRRAVERGDDA